MKHPWDFRNIKRLRRLLHGSTLTPVQVERILDWQLQLPEQAINCSVIEACRLYLNPQPEGETVSAKAKVWERLQSTMQQENAQQPGAFPRAARIPRRRAVILLLVIILVIAFAATGIAIAIWHGVFNFAQDILPQEDYSVQETAGSLVMSNLAFMRLEHVDVTVRQAVYDGYELRVVYAVRDRAATESLPEEAVYKGIFDAALLDGITVCDWIEIDGQHADFSDTFVDIGDVPGEMVYYLAANLTNSGIAPEGEFEVGLPLIRAEPRATVPEALIFTLDAGLTEGLLRKAGLLETTMDGYALSLDTAVFSPVGADVRITFHGGDTEAREKIAYIWGDTARLFTPGGEALGSLWNVHWEFRTEDETTVVFQFTPPENWPKEMVLAIPDSSGQPDVVRWIPVLLV